MTKRTISFYTLGCRTNQSETATLQNLFEQNGYRIVSVGETSAFVVVNTCAVTENSERDARRLVNGIVRKNPNVQIALVGCQAQLRRQTLSTWPNVHWIVGTAQKMDLVKIIGSTTDFSKPQILVSTIARQYVNIPTPGIDREHTRANLKIQEGCDEFCSFCEIPYARGRARSRDLVDIETEARAMVAAGHKEIVLTGINIGKYHSEGKRLIEVLQVLQDIPDLARIRISSIEPAPILTELLAFMKQTPKICRHLHIPIQSGCSTVLKRMGRSYTPKQFEKWIEQAVQTIPDICIGTDVIVGFPGETSSDFEKTHEFLKQSSVHYFHVFSYSDRGFAKSRLFKEKIPIPVIQERSRILRALGEEKRKRFYESMLGQTVSVLFEQKKGPEWFGLTDNFLHVRVPARKNSQNKILPIKLLKVIGQEIHGEMVNFIPPLPHVTKRQKCVIKGA